MNKTFKRQLFCVAVSVLPALAFAQKAGDNIVSFGVASVQPDPSVGTVSTAGTARYPGTPYTVGQVFTGKLVDTSAHISPSSTVSFGWLHMMTDDMGLELALGIPPKLTLDLITPNGTNPTVPAAATVKSLTPAVIGKKFFGATSDKWRPYVGLGVSHVTFSDINPKLSDPIVAALAAQSLKLKSDWTPVYTAGVVYNINDKWSLSGSVSYLPIRTTATFVGSAALGTPVTTAPLKLNTTDYVFKLGYRF